MRISFGELTIDTEQRRLTRRGEDVHISPISNGSQAPGTRVPGRRAMSGRSFRSVLRCASIAIGSALRSNRHCARLIGSPVAGRRSRGLTVIRSASLSCSIVMPSR